MGSVYLGRRVDDAAGFPESLVIKVLHEQVIGDDHMLRRFRHEAMIAVSVRSDELVRVFDAGRVDELPYIAMEYLSGWSVRRWIDEAKQQGRLLSPTLVAAWLVDALRGLSALHRAVHPESQEPLGVVHRDISPKNLMVGPDLRLKVIDLGLGTSNLQDWATRTGALLGTLGYMAPEQVEGRCDPRSDVYALGMVAFEMLALEHYIPRGPTSEMIARMLHPTCRSLRGVRDDLPLELEQALELALAVEPDARFASAEQFRAAIEHLVPAQRTAGELGRVLLEELELMERERALLAAVPVDLLGDEALSTTECFARTNVPEPTAVNLREGTTVHDAPKPLPVRPPARPERRAPPATLMIGVILSMVLGVGLTVWSLGSSGEDVVLQLDAPPAVRATEGARPAAQEPAAAPTDSPPEAIELLKPEPARRSPVRRHREPAAEVKASPSPAPVARPSVEAALDELMRKAESIKRRHPERRQEVDEILGDASIWSRSEDPERARSMLGQLGNKLARLDR
jgi:serine/threonine-protein kinase